MCSAAAADTAQQRNRTGVGSCCPQAEASIGKLESTSEQAGRLTNEHWKIESTNMGKPLFTSTHFVQRFGWSPSQRWHHPAWGPWGVHCRETSEQDGMVSECRVQALLSAGVRWAGAWMVGQHSWQRCLPGGRGRCRSGHRLVPSCMHQCSTWRACTSSTCRSRWRTQYSWRCTAGGMPVVRRVNLRGLGLCVA